MMNQWKFAFSAPQRPARVRFKNKFNSAECFWHMLCTRGNAASFRAKGALPMRNLLMNLLGAITLLIAVQAHAKMCVLTVVEAPMYDQGQNGSLRQDAYGKSHTSYVCENKQENVDQAELQKSGPELHQRLISAIKLVEQKEGVKLISCNDSEKSKIGDQVAHYLAVCFLRD
jgi:hypothetical protein